MPNQNLPKPNLPSSSLGAQPGMTGLSTSPQPVQNLSVNNQVNSPIPPTGAQSASRPNVQPVIERQAQVVPSGLTQQNPGGTPPGIRVKSNDQPLSNVSQIPQPVGAVSVKTVQGGPLGNQTPVKINPPSPNLPLNKPGQLQSAPVPVVKAPVTPSPITNPSLTKSLSPGAPVVAAAKSNLPPANKQVSNSSSNPKQNPAAQPKTAFKLPKIAIFGILALLLLVGAFFLVKALGNKEEKQTPSNNPSSSTKTATPVTLLYWGLWEDSRIISEVIADYENKNPGIKIDYRKQSHVDYRERLQQAIESGNGPDIFRYHATWVPMLNTNLAVLPATVMPVSEFQATFYPTALSQLQYKGQLVGIPLMYDGLALLYNKEMFETANLSVPATWSDLRESAKKLTVPADISERSGGNITQAGMAIGNAGNVDNFSDILALLILQNGGDPADPNSQYVNDALTFYTNFIKVDHVWSDRLPNSTIAFAKGDVAMILVPSWRIHDIKALNPSLDFGVAPVPQLDSNDPVAWSTYWAEGVSNKSKNKDAAWQFLKYMSSPEVLRKFYSNASEMRSFGEIYPRLDMAKEIAQDELVGAYLTDAPYAKSWYLASFTHDNGLNDQSIKYYEDAVNATLTGKNVTDSLKTLESGISSVLTKYNLP